jgi:hypothetical protein
MTLQASMALIGRYTYRYMHKLQPCSVSTLPFPPIASQLDRAQEVLFMYTYISLPFPPMASQLDRAQEVLFIYTYISFPFPPIASQLDRAQEVLYIYTNIYIIANEEHDFTGFDGFDW